MADPKGLLVVPVGFRADGTIHALELDNSDRLKVIIDSVPAPLSSLTFDEDGNLTVSSLPHDVFKLSTVTQVAKQNSATNTTNIIHTVTAGKTFYMTSLFVRIFNGGGGISAGELHVRDVADAIQYYWRIAGAVNAITNEAIGFFTPISIPAGYDICVKSHLAGLEADATITGYEL
jgi:hypothetical protein